MAVVVPARDEEQRIERCLDALLVAADRVREPVHVLVSLDACTDATAEICARRGVSTVVTDGRGVGWARGQGIVAAAGRCVDAGAVAEDIWIANTDADSAVAPEWIAEQLSMARAGADVVLGVVDIPRPSSAFRSLYGSHAGEHPHVHGASMGFSLPAYRRVGGFRAASVGEDVDLAERLDADPALRVVRSTRVRVHTSSRRISRVRDGFADVLVALDAGRVPPVAVRA